MVLSRRECRRGGRGGERRGGDGGERRGGEGRGEKWRGGERRGGEGEDYERVNGICT